MASAEPTSLPPPRPKMPPISEAIATTSVGFHGSIGLFSSEYSAGFSAGIGVGGGDVGVDPVDVALHVFDRLLPGLAVEPRRFVELSLQVGFGVGGEAPLAGVGAGVGAAEEGGEFGAAGVAQHVHQEEPVGGAGVAGAEHRVGAGVP